MTNKKNEWLKVAFSSLKVFVFGGRCWMCGEMELDLLEFAHMFDTGLSGEGRGREERYYDVLNNPQSYALLCRNVCHKFVDELDEESRMDIIRSAFDVTGVQGSVMEVLSKGFIKGVTRFDNRVVDDNSIYWFCRSNLEDMGYDVE